MRGNLGIDDIRKHLLSVADYCRSRFIARALDTKNECHGFYNRELPTLRALFAICRPKTMPHTAKEAAIEVLSTLRQLGYSAYFVGGCVRDLLLGCGPTDYDVATDATSDTVLRVFPQSIAVGAQFGVVLVMVRAQDGKQVFKVEVATYRSDIGYSDGRH